MLNIYRASAGSGKTYRLTQDYIELLFDPKKERNHRRILAVTFTNKATDEMKSRILKELHLLSQGQPSGYRKNLMTKYKMDEDEVNMRARKVLINILHDYSLFSISTIDRFFQQVIRSFARDIGVNGAYTLELDISQTLEQAVDNLFLGLSRKENKQLLSWLTQLVEERIEQSEYWNIRKNIADLGKEIFKESFQYKAEDTKRKLHDREFLNDFRKDLRQIKTDFEQKVKDTAKKALAIISIHGLTTESFKGGKRSAMKTLEKLENGEIKASNTFLSLHEEASLCYAKTTPQNIIDSILSAYSEGLQSCLEQLNTYFTKDIILYNSVNIVLKHLNTLGILSDLAVQIKELTDEQNIMLISDTNMLLNKIIDNSDTPFVYERTGIYIDHYMMDEFQDTSVLQWKNFKPLLSNSMAAGQTNLVVGDVKQSIYRWRNSDWKLLDEQIMDDFRRDEILEENLDTNWRSDKNIIDFNNAFFKKAAELLQAKLNDNISPVISVYENLKPLQHKIIHAYNNLFQQYSPKSGEGYVRVEFINQDENEEGWKEESLKRLPALLENLQDKGYKPNDIAILVRKNDEEQKVIHHLLNYKTTGQAKPQYSYDVLGNEGLLVASASSVRFIIGVLQLFINPEDTIQQSIVSYEYLRGKKGKTEQEALNETFITNRNETGSAFNLFSDEEQELLNKIRNYPLYNMTEQIIALFDIGSWHNEAVFVQAFQDIILKFSTNKAPDLNSFLKWWQKNGEKQCVSSPDSQDTIRIMTIHKSKGLDFPVVILPFCEWDLDSRMRNILWCEPKEAPFDQFGLLPVEYSSKLGQSIFAEEYFDEQMHLYIDSLNIAYVAFTRAKHELICMTPAPQKPVNETEKVNSISTLLNICFQLNNHAGNTIELADHYNTEEQKFELGKSSLLYETTQKKEDETSEHLTDYPVVNSNDRLKIRHKSLEFLLEDTELTANPVNYGTIMHKVLQEITLKSDQGRVLADFVRNGYITEDESLFIQKELAAFWSMPGTEEWFAKDVNVLNEASILTPQGDIYRPDRVILKGEEATVIDYKFGEKEEEHHIRQVLRYMKLITEMGYQCKGYICYISLRKIVEV